MFRLNERGQSLERSSVPARTTVHQPSANHTTQSPETLYARRAEQFEARAERVHPSLEANKRAIQSQELSTRFNKPQESPSGVAGQQLAAGNCIPISIE